VVFVVMLVRILRCCDQDGLEQSPSQQSYDIYLDFEIFDRRQGGSIQSGELKKKEKKKRRKRK
jgi:hypothetical protein